VAALARPRAAYDVVERALLFLPADVVAAGR